MATELEALRVWRCPECGDATTDNGQQRVICKGEGPKHPHEPCATERIEVVPLSELAPLRECRDALTELVTLKDGPRDANYKARKPEAWERARTALRWTDGD